MDGITGGTFLGLAHAVDAVRALFQLREEFLGGPYPTTVARVASSPTDLHLASVVAICGIWSRHGVARGAGRLSIWGTLWNGLQGQTLHRKSLQALSLVCT
ncbi:unnamed protein product [Amoebophrya sp. A25]|nr:unnamed protein product [Amoebophrya sp. A25]|eukprot:GSA25T00023404001.1